MFRFVGIMETRNHCRNEHSGHPSLNFSDKNKNNFAQLSSRFISGRRLHEEGGLSWRRSTTILTRFVQLQSGHLSTKDDQREGRPRTLTMDYGFPKSQKSLPLVQIEWLLPSLQQCSYTLSLSSGASGINLLDAPPYSHPDK